MKRLLPTLLLSLLLVPTALRAGPGDAIVPGDPLARYDARRQAIANRLGPGVLVLFPAADAGVFDQRPEPNLLWLSGVDQPGAVLTIFVDHPRATERSRAARSLSDRFSRISRRLAAASARLRDAGDREAARSTYEAAVSARMAAEEAEELARAGCGPATVTNRLYLPAASAARARWDGPRLSAGEAAASATGIAEVRDLRRLDGDLRSLPAGTRVHLLSGARTTRRLTPALESLKERPELSIRDPSRPLAAARAVKDSEEIARIRRACELTGEGLVDAMRSCRPGMKEYELQAILEFACRRGGAVRQAFRSIVASGPNGTILHYSTNRRRIEDGDLVLMDVGAEYMGYAADVTRTFPAGGRFTPRQAEIYDIVLRAQEAGLRAVRPGATLRDVDRAARKVIADAGYGAAFRHGTSHYVGLDVHDPGPSGALAPGMVLTVEPGIYLDDEALGIRIEDTVLVTKSGFEVLSDGAPKERAEIEARMR